MIKHAQPWCPGRDLVVAGDDTLLHKTGKQIYNVGLLRDPLSPKFRYNLVLGLRYIQLSLLLPLYRCYPGEVQTACALPIRFLLAAVIRKPKGRKPLTEAEAGRIHAGQAAEHPVPIHVGVDQGAAYVDG